MTNLNIKPGKGIMNVHCVVSLGDDYIRVRNTPWFCDYFSNGTFYTKCEGRNKHRVDYISISGSGNKNENGNVEYVQLNTTVSNCNQTQDSVDNSENPDISNIESAFRINQTDFNKEMYTCYKFLLSWRLRTHVVYREDLWIWGSCLFMSEGSAA